MSAALLARIRRLEQAIRGTVVRIRPRWDPLTAEPLDGDELARAVAKHDAEVADLERRGYLVLEVCHGPMKPGPGDIVIERSPGTLGTMQDGSDPQDMPPLGVDPMPDNKPPAPAPAARAAEPPPPPPQVTFSPRKTLADEFTRSSPLSTDQGGELFGRLFSRRGTPSQ